MTIDNDTGRAIFAAFASGADLTPDARERMIAWIAQRDTAADTAEHKLREINRPLPTYAQLTQRLVDGITQHVTRSSSGRQIAEQKLLTDACAQAGRNLVTGIVELLEAASGKEIV